MPNAPEPDHGTTPPGADPGAEQAQDPPTEAYPLVPPDPETETVVIDKPHPVDDPEAIASGQQGERRFTAPGFDAKETAIIATAPEPATEVFNTAPGPAGPPGQPPLPPKSAVPQSFPSRDGSKPRSIARNFNWGWVLAITVIVLALAAIAILGTVLLTRGKHSHVSQEDQVRQAIHGFDTAVQRGDLTQLRGLTCGTTRDGYVDYDERSWNETYQRVSAAKQYPVIASIDQVVVNGQHAEANVTTFMAFDPQLRSTRSLDLQYRDDQWKICQAPSG